MGLAITSTPSASKGEVRCNSPISPTISAAARARALCEPTCPEEIVKSFEEKEYSGKKVSDESLGDLFWRKLSLLRPTIVIQNS